MPKKLQRSEKLLFLAPVLALALFLAGKHYQEHYSYVAPVQVPFACGNRLAVEEGGRSYEVATCDLALTNDSGLLLVFDGYSFPGSSVSFRQNVDGRPGWRRTMAGEKWRNVIAGVGQSHYLQSRYLPYERRFHIRFHEHTIAYSHHRQIVWVNGRAFRIAKSHLSLLLSRGGGVERLDQ